MALTQGGWQENCQDLNPHEDLPADENAKNYNNYIRKLVNILNTIKRSRSQGVIFENVTLLKSAIV